LLDFPFIDYLFFAGFDAFASLAGFAFSGTLAGSFFIVDLL
jgi:hypothetical protein